MKSQDLLLLFKLVSIEQRSNRDTTQNFGSQHRSQWQDWEEPEASLSDDFLEKTGENEFWLSRLSMRGLSEETGISKSEVSQSLRRSYFSGLAKPDRKTDLPKANRTAVLEFIVHGLRYVFPAKPGEVTRGIATGLASPVLQGRLMTAGELVPVWPDARGNSKGLSITPLYKSVPFAVRRDPRLYEYLALADAIRLGQPRERQTAGELLEAILMSKE